MAGLIVDVSHVAYMRQTGRAAHPDPVAAAVLAETAGADGIAVQLQRDRQSIQDRDLRMLREIVQTKLVLALTVSHEMVGIALDIKPDQVILTAESSETNPGGSVDLMILKDTVAETVDTIQNGGIPVGVLIEPDPVQVKLAHKLSVALLQIHTGEYCRSTSTQSRAQAYNKIVDTTKLAYKLKLQTQVGQGLDYQNIKRFNALREINAFCIGHSIVSRAILVGIPMAVKDMLALINRH
ncbi:MAG: pyridoxine 5'-phosphate synthase [Desulfobacterales bacterium]|nr:pyridoxine 5'-phosphate synthase [Desulfobacterales bacterium]